MTDEEIIQKILANQWWPFDRVDPKILEEIMKRQKQETFGGYEESPI